MFRYTIYTQKYHFLLGMTAVAEFHKVFGDSIDSYGKVDDNFIQGIEKMETADFGFTPEFKTAMLEKVIEEKGKCYIITDDFWPDEDRRRWAKSFVQKMDEGHSFQEAQKITNDLIISANQKPVGAQ